MNLKELKTHEYADLHLGGSPRQLRRVGASSEFCASGKL